MSRVTRGKKKLKDVILRNEIIWTRLELMIFKVR